MRAARTTIGALACLMALGGAPAAAQQAPAPGAADAVPQNITLQEFQGASCLIGGATAAIAAAAYRELVSPAVTRGLLPIALMAGAFVAGCVVGSNAAPAMLGFYRRMQ